MPLGPVGGFGAILAQDALDIGAYLTTLAPIDDIPGRQWSLTYSTAFPLVSA